MNKKPDPASSSGGQVQPSRIQPPERIGWIKPFELPPLKLIPQGFDYIPEKNTSNWSPEQIASYMALRARSHRTTVEMIAGMNARFGYSP